jgi:hypothetical protein
MCSAGIAVAELLIKAGEPSSLLSLNLGLEPLRL